MIANVNRDSCYGNNQTLASIGLETDAPGAVPNAASTRAGTEKRSKNTVSSAKKQKQNEHETVTRAQFAASRHENGGAKWARDCSESTICDLEDNSRDHLKMRTRI